MTTQLNLTHCYSVADCTKVLLLSKKAPMAIFRISSDLLKQIRSGQEVLHTIPDLQDLTYNTALEAD